MQYVRIALRNRLKRVFVPMLALVVPLVLGPAVAADLPQRMTQGGVTYLTGGIGEAERTAMRGVRAEYELHAAFAAEKSGAWLAEVAVRIDNASGDTVLRTTTRGPWLYASLPAGRYTLVATYEGITRTVEVPIEAGRPRAVHVYFSVPATLEDPWQR